MCWNAPKPSPSLLCAHTDATSPPVSSDEIEISSSAGNAATWSSSVSHGGFSHSAAWTMVIPLGNPHARPQNQGDGFQFEAPESVHANARAKVGAAGAEAGGVANSNASFRLAIFLAKYGETCIGLCYREALSSTRPVRRKRREKAGKWTHTESGTEGPDVRPIHAWDVPRVMSACGYEVPSFGQDDGDVVEQAESLGRHSSSFKWDLGGKRRDQIDPSHRRSDGNATTSVLQRVCETTDSPILYRIFRGKEKVKIDPSIDVGDNNTYLFMIGEYKFVVNPVLKTLCSPIMKGMFFWTLAELSQEARKNSEFCNNSFDTSVEKRDWQTYHIACNLVACDMSLSSWSLPNTTNSGEMSWEDFGSSDDNIRAMRKDAQTNMGCDELIETTAAALNDNIVASMLSAVQRDQLKLSVQKCSNSFVSVSVPLKGAKRATMTTSVTVHVAVLDLMSHR
ncbi:hypothetical protein EDB86DRAFT_3246519 [Lactarius hatsudake]|nr:hypothetical protein EDB86DRAFT_3246519 [Lactarius hatsudake]